MFKFDLLKHESTHPNETSLTQEYFDTKFGFSVNGEVLQSLEQAESQKKIQDILNGIFTDKRRKSMLQMASRDVKDRPVRYFRYISWERLIDLLKQGEQVPFRKEKVLEASDLKHFRYFILEYITHKDEFIKLSDTFEKEEELSKMSLVDLLKIAFPQVLPKQIDDLLLNPTQSKIKEFVDNHIDNRTKKRAHSGSMNMDFVNYLSVSVGGVIRNRLNYQRIEQPTVYLEMVIPDEKIILQPEGSEGEKEVLVKKIKLSNITRVCLDEDLRTKILLGNDSNIWAYAIANDPKLSQSIGPYYDTQKLVENWRWYSPINEYLPKSMAKRKASRGV